MTRWGRVARGTVAASASVFFAAFAHAVAGGDLPGVAGLSLCFVFSIIVGTALAGRRMPRVRLAASILASQAMYHGLFGSLGTLESTAVSRAATVGHVHNAPPDFGSLTVQVHEHGNMLLAHVAAAIVTFGVLAFGERSLRTVVRAARSIVLALIPRFTDAPLADAPSLLSVHRVHQVGPRRYRVNHSGLRHRGPPLARVS
ncbi:MAG: hypothetical protein ABIW32_06115 [Terrimesophilobacter sp.]